MPDKVITADTDCRKCGTPMEMPEPVRSGSWAGATMTITAYACKKCGHWNDLKRRKAKKKADV